jgi:adenylylsulfate kinase
LPFFIDKNFKVKYRKAMDNQLSQHIKWQEQAVVRPMRESVNQHKSMVIWLTGLSGAGKSTIAKTLEQYLFQQGCKTYVLDGDNIRHGLCSDLQFTDKDRAENIRRAGEVSKLFLDAGVIVISAFISPFKSDRDVVRALFNEGDFIEVYCKADIDVCEKRDVKGIYAKVRQGLIEQFTGISSPYEIPKNPELILDTFEYNIEECVNQVISYLKMRNLI